MKKGKALLGLLLAGLLMTQCKDKQEPTLDTNTTESIESAVTPQEKSVQEPTAQIALLGTYLGVYPWEEEGQNMQMLKITAVIKEDNVYTYKVVTEDSEHNESGEWEMDGDRLYLREDDNSAAKAFLVKAGRLHFLDSEGDVVNENESGDYILTRK